MSRLAEISIVQGELHIFLLTSELQPCDENRFFSGGWALLPVFDTVRILSADISEGRGKKVSVIACLFASA